MLRPCQHDDGYIDGRSQIKVHTDERTQISSAWSSLTVTHPCTNQDRRCLTSVSYLEISCSFFIAPIVILVFIAIYKYHVVLL